MLRFVRTFSFLCVFALISLTVSAAEIQPVRYVFLFIGDGMSFAQQQMTEEFVRQTGRPELRMSSMPYWAITTTHGADVFVTESAAAATAIASGVKATGGAVGLDASGQPVETIAQLALRNGRKVGIISSVTINHATPAAFYAHNVSRNNMYEIALDMVASGFHYFGGGGVDQRDNRNSLHYQGHIYDLAREAGYIVVRTFDEIRALKPEALEPGVGKVMAFPYNLAMPYAMDSNEGDMRLPEFTRQAIELLDNPNGFFIMVEGGKIDWACHANDAAATVWDMIEFDEAISVAFEFAETRPGEVLIVVTGDHETGMLNVSHSSTAAQNYVSLLANQTASFEVLIPMSERLVRQHGEEMTFEQFKPFITENTGLIFTEEGRWQRGNLHLTRAEMTELENDFNRSKRAILDNQSGRDRVVRTMIRILNNKSGITWGSGGHTAMPVPTSAWGSAGLELQAEQIIRRIRDNTDIGIQLRPTVGALAN